MTAGREKILYITYDGLTDPLGQSQILPYLAGLSKQGYRFTILSFEKKDRFASNGKAIGEMVNAYGIKWVPLSFTKNPPVLSKFYDTVRMRMKAVSLQRRENFDMVHCRSYIAADIGLRLKRKFGVKFFFDMRGFWADEKRDGGAWKDDHPIFKRVYRYYKKREAEFLENADHIISLTEAGKTEMETWPAFRRSVPVTVIPCCADMDHFSLTSVQQKVSSRERLNIGRDRLVVSYLGSVGAWYLLDEMLQFFTCVKRQYANALFLFVTHSSKEFIMEKAKAHSIADGDIQIIEAGRGDVPLFIKASDINISFIRPVYSKLSSSPTKLGEVLSMGIPVVVNAGVGDVQSIVNQTGSGFVLTDLSAGAMEYAVSQIPILLQLNSCNIREKAKEIFDLGKGIALYSRAYDETLQKRG